MDIEINVIAHCTETYCKDDFDMNSLPQERQSFPVVRIS